MTTTAANLATECFQTIGACALRATRLTASGAFAPAPDNVYVSDSLMDLAPKRNVIKGDSFNAKDGCGNIRATFRGCDTPDSVDLTINFLEFEPSLWEMLTGGTIYTRSGKVVGWDDRPSGSGCPHGVSIEAWSRAWDSNEQVVDATTGALVYLRVGFPKVVFSLGDYTLGNDVTKYPLTGQGTTNSRFRQGPYNDWPGNLNGLTAQFADTGFPTASCGYQSRTES